MRPQQSLSLALPVSPASARRGLQLRTCPAAVGAMHDSNVESGQMDLFVLPTDTRVVPSLITPR